MICGCFHPELDAVSGIGYMPVPFARRGELLLTLGIALDAGLTPENLQITSPYFVMLGDGPDEFSLYEILDRENPRPPLDQAQLDHIEQMMRETVARGPM